MQKISFKLSQRVIDIQKFIVNNMPTAVEIPNLADVMMEIVLREANNSETDVLDEMVKDMINGKAMNAKNPRALQVALQTVCGVYHFYDIYNGFDELMHHLNDSIWYVHDGTSVTKYKRTMLRSDIDLDEFDLDLTNMTMRWFGAVFTDSVQKVFNKYIVDRGHYDTIFGTGRNRAHDVWPDDSTPLSEQMKVRAVFILVISVLAMLYK